MKLIRRLVIFNAIDATIKGFRTGVKLVEGSFPIYFAAYCDEMQKLAPHLRKKPNLWKLGFLGFMTLS